MSFTFEDMKEKIKCGINYGNALECFYDSTHDCPIIFNIKHDVVDDTGVSHPFKIDITHYKNDGLEPGVATFWAIEEMWRNPETTDAIINFYKQLGFTAIRLPVNMTWHHEFGSRETDTHYIKYVRSVIDKIINADLFCCVVLFCEAFKTRSVDNAIMHYRDPENNDNVKLIVQHWNELATALLDIPEDKLTFDLLNEFSLGVKGDITESCQIIAKIYEMCIDTIRKTGGFNTNRLIGIGGYRADANLTYDKFEFFSYMLEDTRNYLSFAMYLMPEYTFCYKDAFNNKEKWGYPMITSERINADLHGFVELHKLGYNMTVSEYGVAGITNYEGELETDDDKAACRRILISLAIIERIFQDMLKLPAYYWDSGSVFDRRNFTINVNDIYDIITLNLSDMALEYNRNFIDISKINE